VIGGRVTDRPTGFRAIGLPSRVALRSVSSRAISHGGAVKTEAVLEQLERALPSGLSTTFRRACVPLYARRGGSRGILRKKVVWATQFEHLNDKSELVEGDRLVHEVAVELNAVIGLSKLQTLIRESFLEKSRRWRSAR